DSGEGCSDLVVARRPTVADGSALVLQLTVFGGEWQAGMDVLLDGRKLGSVVLDGKGRDDLVVEEIALPAEAASAMRGDGTRVEFVAHPGKRTPRLFEVRVTAGTQHE